MRSLPILAVLVLSLPLGTARADDLAALVPKAFSAPDALSALRAAGPAGLTAVAAAYDDALLRMRRTENPDPLDQPAWDALFDAVGQQRLCRHSRLYWHTDLEAAKAAARAAGRPILSLHLLGSLTDEYSCANSRFFRSALYANRAVSDYLRQHVVLHWWTTRDVPKVTVTFADGRELRTTITGNSVHHLLDAEGAPIDALPGLYGPGAFLAALGPAVEMAGRLRGLAGAQRAELLSAYHAGRLSSIRRVVETAAELTGLPIPEPASEPAAIDPGQQGIAAEPVPAARAAPLAQTKRMVEFPVLRAIGAAPVVERDSDDQVRQWHALAAALPPADYALDRASFLLIRDQLLAADPDPARATAASEAFTRSLARDTVYNQWRLHARIHAWFAGTHPDLEALNARIYSELFATPPDDPWMGLDPGLVYSGLDRGGVVAGGETVPSYR